MTWHYETPDGRPTTWAELLERFEQWKRDQRPQPVADLICAAVYGPRRYPCRAYRIGRSAFCAAHQNARRRKRNRPELRLVS